MSRVITHNNIQWTGVPTEFLGRRGTYGAVQSTGPESDAFTGTSSDTYCDYNPATGGEGGPVFGFGTINIPANATINSVTCSVKIRCSNSNGMTTATIQLYAGEIAKGTAIDFVNDTSTSPRTFSNTGSWTREEIDSICLFINSRRSSNRRIYFYGADLTITYSYNETEYEIITSSQSISVTVSPASQYVIEGNTGTINFNNIADITEINVKDNNISVTGDLVNTSGTTYTYTIENIDSDHSITVQDVPSVYVTVVNNSTKVSSIIPTSGTTVKVGQGSNVNIKIYTNEINHINIFDNDVKNNNTTLEREIVDTTTTCIPGSYSENTFSTFTATGNGYADTTSTTRVTCQPGSKNSTQSVYFNFNVSSIPSDAVIHSVSCKVKICVSNSFSSTDTGIQLYSGTTSKSSRNYSGWYQNTTPNVYTLSNVETFTRAELDNARLKITGRTGTAGRSIYFYGAELIVDYEYAGDTYYLYTTFGTTTKTVRIEDRPTYSIASSSNFSGVTISSSAASVYEGESATITVNVSDLSEVSILDNGTDITSLFSGSNGTYTYTLSNITVNHTIVVNEVSSSQPAYIKVNGQYVTIAKIWKKVNNVWVEQTDYSTLFDNSHIYVHP